MTHDILHYIHRPLSQSDRLRKERTMSTLALPAAPTNGLALLFEGVIGLRVLEAGEDYLIALVTATGPGLEGTVEALVGSIVNGVASNGVNLHGRCRGVVTHLSDGDYCLIIRGLDA